MDVMTVGGLVLAGVATGLVGYLTGLASLVSYPAMLAAGLPPVAANVSQTLGLVGVGAGAALRTTPVLLEQGRRDFAVQFGLSAACGIVGAATLLIAGERSFVAIVPWLIALASVAVLAAPRVRAMRGGRHTPRWVYYSGIVPVSTYAGYFGAGAGTIYLALATLTTREAFGRSILMKSVLLSAANLTASVVFILFGPVDWPAAIALGLGCLVGGHLGPKAQGLVPEHVLRLVVAACGFGLAWWLAVR